MHTWAAAHGGVMTAASVFYVVAQVAVAGWALLWTWWLRRDAVQVVRDAFVGAQRLALAVNVLIPTAPPRLLPGGAFGDPLAGAGARTS